MRIYPSRLHGGILPWDFEVARLAAKRDGQRFALIGSFWHLVFLLDQRPLRSEKLPSR